MKALKSRGLVGTFAAHETGMRRACDWKLDDDGGVAIASVASIVLVPDALLFDSPLELRS